VAVLDTLTLIILQSKAVNLAPLSSVKTGIFLTNRKKNISISRNALRRELNSKYLFGFSVYYNGHLCCIILQMPTFSTSPKLEPQPSTG
jgi:hypothetical protein